MENILDKMVNKKSQTEIIGLLIIVILIVIVISVILRFSVTDKPEPIQKEYMQDQMATSFLLTLLRTNTNCTNHITFERALEDCVKGRNVNCPGFTDTCDYVNKTVDLILNRTLDKWSNYKLDIYHMPSNLNLTYLNDYYGNSTYEKAHYSIPVWPQLGSIKVELTMSR